MRLTERTRAKVTPDSLEAEYYPCFICYGDPDSAFANRLVEDLRGMGVICWPHELGSSFTKAKRRKAGKIVIVSSSRTLVRDEALKAIEELIDKEYHKIVLVSLDNAWQESEFVIVTDGSELIDFSSPVRYDESVTCLLNALIEGIDETSEVYRQRCEAMSSAKRIDRYEQSHKDYAAMEKLLPYSVEPHQKLLPEKCNELRNLVKTSRSEKPIQRFLKNNPSFLTRLLQPAHHGQFCIPQPQLGSQFKPDFLISGMDSAGIWWYGVELESPMGRMLCSNGDSTRDLNHALRQIEDWRGWIRQNINYAQSVDHGLGLTQIDADLPCILVIGRRENETFDRNKLPMRRRDLSRRDKAGLLIHHYEWLLEGLPGY